MSTGKVILSVLGGVAAGAMLGVLFAPNKGSRTRKKIARKGEDYTDMLQEKFNDFFESINEKIEKMEEDVSNFANKAQAKTDALKKDLKTA